MDLKEHKTIKERRKQMTEEEKLAISRLAINAIDYERRLGKKLYKYDDGDVKFDSATDAQTALNYIIKICGGKNDTEEN